MSTKNSGYLGGVLLVAGTCIGAGMIGVPVKTAASGFYPTLIAFVLVLAIMTMSALLFLEASLVKTFLFSCHVSFSFSCNANPNPEVKSHI